MGVFAQHRHPPLVLDGGRLPTTDDIVTSADRLRAVLDDLAGRAQQAGVPRADFTSADIPLPHGSPSPVNVPPRSTCGTST
ncbi:hypothetical protein [Streptomyces sp. NL15-2K]|uniref:hypothetical protein n=1 Tax=Streptomyces sp. NL15-2K TaxID=376149 RepID=UPI000FFAA3E3|nr:MULTISPECIES: hypothetical protein [Actinomycetes]WKX15351.1 hypothetical protein Q4V64_50805 [Kutzneria buriramensis]GCB53326.1 hypothetical protein SNL152K_10683 [Streptomyces sp. NL15-2K]